MSLGVVTLVWFRFGRSLCRSRNERRVSTRRVVLASFALDIITNGSGNFSWDG